MSVEWALADDAATRALGAALAKSTSDAPTRVALNGPLGAGKSTLVRGALEALGWQGAVPSPTYTLVEPYSVGRRVWHLDLYRLESPEAWYALGVEDGDPDLLFVEWPKQAGDALVRPDLTVALDYVLAADGQPASRRVRVQPQTARGRTVVESLRATFKCDT